MPYELVPLGDLSGGMNEAFPPSRIRENEAALLQNMEYINGNIYPETRRGTQFDARFGDGFILGLGCLNLEATSHILVAHLPDGSTTTEFWGKAPAGSYTSRGTIVSQSAWVSTTFESVLIVGGGGTTYKWTGTGNVAALGGTPPTGITSMCVWNNRVWAVETNSNIIEFCKLGDAEDWTDTDPVSGAGFITVDGGYIISVIAYRERLIVFKKDSIHQVMASLPNTDPAGWRVELLYSRGGLDHDEGKCEISNDLIFHDPQSGWQRLSSVTSFGDFETKSISNNIDNSYTLGATIFAGSVENKALICMPSGNVAGDFFCLEVTQDGSPRWSRFKFTTPTGGAPTVARVNDQLYINGKRKVAIAVGYTISGGTETDLFYWPNDETDDDKYKDYVGDSAALEFETRTKLRAWDGGSIIEMKQLSEIGAAFQKLSTTGFTASGDLVIKLYYDEDSTASENISLTDAASTTAQHEKRLKPSSSDGRRFHSFQMELATSKIGLGVRIKDFDAKVTQASRAFHDTCSQL